MRTISEYPAASRQPCGAFRIRYPSSTADREGFDVPEHGFVKHLRILYRCEMAQALQQLESCVAERIRDMAGMIRFYEFIPIALYHRNRHRNPFQIPCPIVRLASLHGVELGLEVIESVESRGHTRKVQLVPQQAIPDRFGHPEFQGSRWIDIACKKKDARHE